MAPEGMTWDDKRRAPSVPEGGWGGNLTFMAGKGTGDHGSKDGAFIICQADGTEALRVAPDGFYVEKRKVASDHALYKAFAKWMSTAVVDYVVPDNQDDGVSFRLRSGGADGQ